MAAILGVIVLLCFMAVFGWTSWDTHDGTPVRVAADPVCVATWNRDVAASVRRPGVRPLPGAPRRAWVVREFGQGACTVTIEGWHKWALRYGGWSYGYPHLVRMGDPNAVAAADGTVRPVP